MSVKRPFQNRVRDCNGAGSHGSEASPTFRLDDGAPAMEARLLPSASLNESIRVYSAAERALLQFPEVANIVTKRSRGSRNRPCRRGRRRWVRSDIAIKLFGNDLETLRRTAERIAQVVGRVAGAQE
jgi:Cu/Ag efflux pump CusA